jgi:hypothetical protein
VSCARFSYARLKKLEIKATGCDAINSGSELHTHEMIIR